MRWAVLLAIVACSKTAEPPAESASKREAPTPKREDRNEPAIAAPKLKLAVTIAGASATWTDEAFADVPKMAGVASDGEARETWSLRELVHRNVGPSARVVAVTGPDGKQPVEATAWADASQTPILHSTRRGSLKFRWADKDGRWGETIVKGVTGLEITR
jgi:hypothetical protein